MDKRDTRVATLAELRDDGKECKQRQRDFVGASGLNDELAVFFPTAPENCLAFVIGRSRGRFRRSDIERAHLIYPAMDGLHRAHLDHVFSKLANGRLQRGRW